jgi:hypothetical protein
MPFMAYSLQPTVAVDIRYWLGNALLDQEKAGGRYAADLILQLPARAGSVALHSALRDSTGYVVDAIARGYEMTVLRSVRTGESG